MKLLLDEDFPEELRNDIAGHDVFNARYAGLRGVRNGDLLLRAAELGFEVLVTGDQDMVYQQNHRTLPISVVILKAHPAMIHQYQLLIPQLQTTLTVLPRNSFVVVT